ncbi:AAA family ATPase [Desulfovibrio sp. QI0430]
MKNIFLIGGTMGVGKTTTCKILMKKLNNSVFLDGDWCWDMHPFKVTEETKNMVMENICFVLNNYIKCSSYKNIVFCWVMHEQKIIDNILSHLDIKQCNIHLISLICEKDELKKRITRDIDNGLRTNDTINMSIDRISCYTKLNTYKIDVSSITPEQAAILIFNNFF